MTTANVLSNFINSLKNNSFINRLVMKEYLLGNKISCGVHTTQIRGQNTGKPGSGVGKGGGGGGSIRESGGSLGEYGTSQEDGYFYKKQREQLEKIKGKKTKEKGTTDPAESSNKLKEKDDK